MLNPVFESAIVQLSAADFKKIKKDYEEHQKLIPENKEINSIEQVMGNFLILGFNVAREATQKRKEYLKQLGR